MSKRYIIPAAIRGRYAGGGKIIQRLEVRPNMCTNTLTGVQKDNVLIEIDESEEVDAMKVYVFSKIMSAALFAPLMGGGTRE